MDLKNKILKGATWSGLQGISMQAIQFMTGIVLARLLSPTEYGTIGLLTVFIAISQVLIDSGFSRALIQKQERTDTDIATVFLFNLLVSAVCYIILWAIAPLIANFYNDSDLILLLRVLSFSLIFSAFGAVQFTLFTIALDFKSIAKINLVSSLTSGLIAIYLAYNGLGVWSLVIQSLLRELLKLPLLYFFFGRWRPALKFSRNSFKRLFSFGSKLLISSLLHASVNNLASLFIARALSTKDLGLYIRGTQFADIGYTTFNSVIDSIILPSLSPLQKDQKLLIQYTKNLIKTSCLIAAPFFLGIACLAEPIIQFLLTDKWILAVPIMQIICVARFITIISGFNINLLYVLGRTDLVLKQQTIKLTIRVALLLAALKFGIVMIAIAELVSTAIHFFINTYYPGKIMNYNALKQIRDISPIVISSLAMSLTVTLIIQPVDSVLLKIFVGAFCAIVIYVFLILYVFKVPEFRKFMTLIKKNIKAFKA